jgi:LPS O-antigen subunit length determinant protein (WzzB/FepE family)
MQLQDQIDSMKNQARIERLDDIKRLKEALGIAQRLGIKEPLVLAGLSTELHSPDATAIYPSITQPVDPLFILGTRIIEAQILALENRDSDVPFQPRIREFAAELSALEKDRRTAALRNRKNHAAFAYSVMDRTEVTKTVEESQDDLDSSMANLNELRANLQFVRMELAENFADVSLLRLDQAAISPRNPVEPNKFLVLTTALFFGVFAGILLAVLVHLSTSREDRPVS